MAKFERLFLVLNLIRSRPGIKASELASDTGVSQRTIYRDILSLAGQYPVVCNKGYRMLPTAYLKTMNITRAEYKLLQGALCCPALKRPNLKIAAKGLKAKIDTVIDPSVRDSKPAYISSCAFAVAEESNSRKLRAIYTALEEAIEHSRIAELCWEGSSNGHSQEIHPYALVYFLHDWFLVGYSCLKKDFEGIRLSSVSRVSLSNKSFQKDQNFSLSDFFKSRWGIKGGEETIVKVRFTGKAALEILETTHHPEEKVIKIGEKEVIYSVTIKGTDEIIRWILGFGPEAEVLAPQSLKRQVAEMLTQQLGLYGEQKESAARRKSFAMQVNPD